jgi:hypothetical protein
MKLLTSNCCTRAGWVEHYAANDFQDLHLSVAPDADLDDVVLAFDHDEQEMMTVHGWCYRWERVDA